jgi:tetratricopeptide (TPR) repeat protein
MSHQQFQEYLESATACYEQGQYQQCLDLYQQALLEEPNNTEVLAMIALLYHQFFGKLHDAKRVYKQILSLDPTHKEALESLAILYYEQEEFSKATKLFSKLISLHPSSIDAYLYLAAICLSRNQLHKALGYYQTVVKYRPKHYQSLLAMADIYAQMDTHQAEVLYTYLLNFNPQDTTIMLRLADLCCHQHLFEEAEIWLKKAILCNDKSLDALLALGNLLAKRPSKQLDAEYWLQKAFHLDESSLKTTLALANFYRHNHYEHEAETFFQKALCLDPANFTAFVQLTGLFLEQQRLEEANQLLGIASNDYANQPKIQLLWAKHAQACHNLGKAETHLLKAIALEPENPQTIESLARLYLYDHRLNECELLLYELLHNHPRYQKANYLLSLVQMERTTETTAAKNQP